MASKGNILASVDSGLQTLTCLMEQFIRLITSSPNCDDVFTADSNWPSPRVHHFGPVYGLPEATWLLSYCPSHFHALCNKLSLIVTSWFLHFCFQSKTHVNRTYRMICENLVINCFLEVGILVSSILHLQFNPVNLWLKIFHSVIKCTL